MAILSLLRTIAFGTGVVLSVIVLGAAADLTNITTTAPISFYWSFQPLAIAVAVLTMLSLSAMFVVDMVRTGAFSSMIVVELGWVFVLSVLWIATAASTSTVNATLLTHDCTQYAGKNATACSEIQVTEAFSFLLWLILLGYSVTILAFAINSAIKGQAVWFVSVKGAYSSGNVASISAPATAPTIAVYAPSSPYYTPVSPALQNGQFDSYVPPTVTASYQASVPLATLEHGQFPPSSPAQAPSVSPLGPQTPSYPQPSSPVHGHPGQGYNPNQNHAYQNQGPSPQQGYPSQIYPNQGGYQVPQNPGSYAHV